VVSGSLGVDGQRFLNLPAGVDVKITRHRFRRFQREWPSRNFANFSWISAS
jgi:hypothetical protein